MQTSRSSLSVIVITKNEHDRIARCLQSVHGWVDEIILFDSGSTDDTVAIAKKFTDKIWNTDWPGYGPQKQRALEKSTCDWVLSIDADEVVTAELRDEICDLLSGQPKNDAYRIPWGVMLLDRQLKYGRSARSPLRLFRREGAHFSDALVHETVVTRSGKNGKLRGKLLHYSNRDYRHALEKSQLYACLWAQQKFAVGKRTGLLAAVLHGGWMFVHVYIFRLGFFDGSRGLMMASLYGQYTFNKYAALWALHQSPTDNPSEDS